LKKDWIQKIKDLLSKGDEGGKQKKTYRYLAIILIAGILLMAASMFTNKPTPENGQTNTVYQASSTQDTKEEESVTTWKSTSSKKSGSIGDIEKMYESELKDTLETMKGVSNVSVIVNIDATESKVYEKNSVAQRQTTEETDRDGGERKVEDFSTDEKIVIIREGDKEVPLVKETKKPAIRGVLIVAKGADDIRIKKEIIEAVTRVLDVPSHRVAVSAKK
jgi:stage III sporulation protein AG